MRSIIIIFILLDFFLVFAQPINKNTCSHIKNWANCKIDSDCIIARWKSCSMQKATVINKKYRHCFPQGDIDKECRNHPGTDSLNYSAAFCKIKKGKKRGECHGRCLNSKKPNFKLTSCPET